MIAYIRENGESLKIDGERIGIYASSSNPPVAISYVNQDDRRFIKAVVYYYGSMYTPDGKFNDALDRECNQFGCYGPSELPPLEQLRRDLPTMIVRTGRHNGENPSIDNYVTVALKWNLPLTIINYPRGMHGFDVPGSGPRNAAARSVEIVRFTLDFLMSHLMPE